MGELRVWSEKGGLDMRDYYLGLERTRRCVFGERNEAIVS